MSDSSHFKRRFSLGLSGTSSGSYQPPSPLASVKFVVVAALLAACSTAPDNSSSADNGVAAALPSGAVAPAVPPASPAQPATELEEAPAAEPTPPAALPSPVAPSEPEAPMPPATVPPAAMPQSPASLVPEPPVEPPPVRRNPGDLRLLSYSLIGGERITGSSPQCNNAGDDCNYSYNRTARGYTHSTISAGNDVIRALAQEHGFEVTIYDGNQRDDVIEEFTGDNLTQYDAIIFNNPNGLGMNQAHREAFQAYINQGGGYIGIHAGINCEKDWEWFHNFVGAFETGVDANNRHALTVTRDISTDHLGDTWALTDEWHKHSRRADTQTNVKVLLQRDGWPIAWYQEHSGGRMWYTGLGHNASVFADERFATHLWGGIRWATGLTEGRQ